MNFRRCRPEKTRYASLFLFFVLISGYVCFSSCEPQKLETITLVIERAGGEAVQMKAEIAKTDEERNKGLMFRKKLPDGEGMIFVFERDQQLSFWMLNTYIPLSIAFIASDGRIIEIKDMQPHNEDSVKSSRSVRYALEVPQGWFDRVNIKPGDKVRIDFL